MPAVEARGIRKRYGNTQALSGIDITIESGETYALLGPNGAGKTTTVEILEGQRHRDAGTISVLGHDPGRGERAFLSRVGIVLEDAGLEDELTPREAVDHVAAYYPNPRPTKEALAMVGLGPQATTRIGNLSHGQRRRLDFALALVPNPELLFLDEPTSGFDPSARRSAWRVITDLKASGVTILLTTHYMDEAHALADRVAIISRGRIAAEGPPGELGDRDRETEVRFLAPRDAAVPRLPADLGVVRREGREFVVATHNPTRLLHGLTAWAVANGEELEDLTVRRATLEDVYLRLVGGADGYDG